MMLRYRFLIVLLCLFLVGTGIAQDRNSGTVLNVMGIAELEMRPLSGATVTLFDGNNEVTSSTTRANGRFTFNLEANKEYTIEVSKEGLVSKRIAFNTTMPEDEQGEWTNEFSIGLVKYCDGVDYSILNEPVDIVEFDARRREFISNRDYVTNMRPKIERILSSYDECMLDKYDAAIREAEQMVSQKNYQEALLNYEAALEIYPDNNYPAKQLSEIKTLIRREEIAEDAYNKAIAEADALFERQNYKDALGRYQEASKIKPQDPYSGQKIIETQEAYSAQQTEIKVQRELEDAYNSALVKAGVAYQQKDYQTALEYYQTASDIKPSEPLPTTRQGEINEILEKKAAEEARKKEIDEAYNNAVARAQELQQNKEYDAAREQYALAMSIKPSAAEPKKKMDEIDRAVEAEIRAEENAKRAAAEALQQQREQEYSAAMLRGADALIQKKYEDAKAAFQDALSIKPGDTSAELKLGEVEHVIAEEKNRLLTEQKRQTDYDATLARGEDLLGRQEFNEAKNAFEDALEIMPAESYPKQKIDEINAIFAEKDRLIREQQALDNAYDMALVSADKYFKAKEYELARNEYARAVLLKPDETLPKTMLEEVEKTILLRDQAKAEALARSDMYAATINTANDLFKQKQYQEARINYDLALKQIPGDAYATDQIAKIDHLISEQEKQRQMEELRLREYEEFIALADREFDAGSYIQARKDYNEALKRDPYSSYAKQKIERIDEISRILSDTSTRTSVRGEEQQGTISQVPLNELDFNTDVEKEIYFEDLRQSYPDGITLEIYKEEYKETLRYIVIRNENVREFRKIRFLTFEGVEYSVDGKPITMLYFLSQIKQREGEQFKETVMQ